MNSASNLFSVFFGEGPAERGVHNYEQAQQQDADMYKTFFHAMLDAGVALPPSGFEAWFVSAAHDDTALNRIFEAIPKAADAVKEKHLE